MFLFFLLHTGFIDDRVLHRVMWCCFARGGVCVLYVCTPRLAKSVTKRAAVAVARRDDQVHVPLSARLRAAGGEAHTSHLTLGGAHHYFFISIYLFK